jgi:post-segregation antitoxin (ccd killing protein)
MVTKVNACLYIDRKVLEAAKQMGLNVSKVSENALVEAIRRLGGQEPEAGLDSPARAEGRGRDCERNWLKRASV